MFRHCASGLSLCLLLSVGLTGCGDAPPDPISGGSGYAGGGVEAIESTMLKMASTPLDDEILADLLATHRRVLEAGGDMSAARRVAGDLKQYTTRLTAWQAIKHASKDGRKAWDRRLAGHEASLRHLEAQLRDAKDSERAALEARVEQQRTRHKSIQEQARVLAKLASDKNRALVERWKSKFEALEEEFDE